MRGLKRKDTPIISDYQIFHITQDHMKDWLVKYLLKLAELRLKVRING
jgi:hypothetical protein